MHPRILLTIFFIMSILYILAFGSLFMEPVNQTFCQGVSDVRTVPYGALWSEETTREQSVPEDYFYAVGWVNIATVLPCVGTKDSFVEIETFRIIEQNKAGEERIIFEQKFDTEKREGFEGGLFQRLPVWFGPGESERRGVERFTTEGLLINTHQFPQAVYHGWSDPRVAIDTEAVHFVEANVRISGNARLQLGLDYWKDKETDYSGYDEECIQSENCEAFIGNWYGDTEGEFLTFRTPVDRE